MQPKFTPKNLKSFCTKIIALALIFSASSQFSFAQKGAAKSAQQKPGYENTLSLFESQKAKQASNKAVQKPVQQAQNAKTGKVTANDAGILVKASEEINSPQGVCTTFTGNLAAGDPTLAGPRMFRDGIPSTCAAPKAVCPGTSGVAGNWYDTYTFVNPSASAQCITVDFTNTSANTFAHFASAHSGSFNPANICSNYLADQGGSAANGATTSFEFTLPGSATVVLVVTSVNPGTGGTYSMAVSAPVGCGAASPCTWSASTVYPIGVLDQGNVTVGTTLYSFAGVSANAVIATSYKFDGTVWTPIAPTPQALEYPGVCSDGTNIYILGGASNVGTPLTTLYRYNIASNTYTTLAPFTVGVWNTAAVYMAGKIYKIGGTGPATASTNAVEIYDVAGGTWSMGTPYPIAASFIGAIAQGGFIYTAGGNASGIEQTKTYRFDPAGAGSWNDAVFADLSATRWGSAHAFYNNTFIMAGGYSAAAITNTVLAYDIGLNSWSAMPNMLTNRARMNGAVLGGAFYVIGGRQINDFVGTNNNQRLFCIPPTPCAGTPAPGNTISTSNPVCSGTTFTLSLQNNPFVSGFTYDWEFAAAAAGPWSNLPGGSNITHTLTQAGATWYRCNVTCTPSGLTGTSTPLLVADGQGVFNTHPVNTSVVCGGVTSFSFTATGASLTYSWERRINAASPWLVVNNGGVYSGATTNTLTITNPDITLNGNQFRGIMQGPCTAVDFSNVATLTVTPLVATVTPSSATICTGTILQLTLTNVPTPTVFSSGPINVPIPDNTNVATTQTLAVAGLPAAIPSEIRVTLNMPHTYPADMVFNLRAPNNQILSLYKHNGNTDNGPAAIPTAGFYDAVVNNLSAIAFVSVPTPFRYGQTAPAGPYRPDAMNGVTNPGYVIMDPPGHVSNALTFNDLFGPGGANLNGNWTLAMVDGGPGDLGTLTSWSISFSFGTSSGVWTASPAAPNTMWINAAANNPYIPGSLAGTIWVNPTVNTNYSVVYSTSTPCVSAPTVVPVSVTNPVSAVNSPSNRTVCVGTNASFSVSASGGPLTYQWQVSVDGGVTYSNIAGATGSTLNLTAVTQLMNNNLYRVVVTAAPCGSSTSAAARLNVLQLPIVTISSNFLQLVPGRVATITGTSVPPPFSATSWSWTLNGNTIAGATGNVVTANIDQQGSYRATVTDNQVLVPASPLGGCTNSSNTIVIGSEASDNLWIIPNPNNGQFQIRLFYNGVMGERRIIKIYSSGGQLMAQKEVDMDSFTPPYASISFNLPTLAAGTYVVKVVDRNSQNITSGLMVIQ